MVSLFPSVSSSTDEYSSSFPIFICNGSSLWWSPDPSRVPAPSECAQFSLFVWAPALFFWALSPVLALQLWRVRKRPVELRQSLPLSRMILAKMTICCLLLPTSLLLLFKHFDPDDFYAHRFPTHSLITPLIQSFTMFGLFLALLMCQLHGVVSSGILHLSWLIHWLCAVPELYGWYQKLFSASPEFPEAAALDPMRLGAALCWNLGLLAQCVLFAWADPRDTDGDGNGGDGDAPSTSVDLQQNKKDPIHRQQAHPPNRSPELGSSFLNRITYSWFGTLPRLGRKRDLTVPDLFGLNPGSQCRWLNPKWERSWVPAVQKFYEKRRRALAEQLGHTLLSNNNHKSNGKQFGEEINGGLGLPTQRKMSKGRRKGAGRDALPTPSVVWALFKMFKYELMSSAAIKLVSDLLQFANPLLLQQLIRYVSDPDAHLWQGVGYALAMFACSEVRSLCVNYYFFVMFRMGTKIQSTLTLAVYRKTLRLSNAARRDRTVGEIVNLMAIDTERFAMITAQIHQFWSSPLQISIALALLFNVLGVAALPGVLIMAVLIPLSFISSLLTRRWQMRQMRARDERSKLCNEVLNGIKVVKLYAWERPMVAALERIRARELHLLLKAGLVRSVIETFNFTSPFLVAIGSFLTFVLLDGSGRALTPQIAFVSLTLFNQIRSPMTMIGLLINLFVQTSVSSQRMREFLVAPELEVQQLQSDASVKETHAPNAGNTLMRIQDVDFSWDAASPDAGASATAQSRRPSSAFPTLRGISLQLQAGRLHAVVGKVGTGKSSLIAALLGEMERVRGDVWQRAGVSVAYVPQVAWIQNMSLRDNITFGRPFDPAWYARVVDACALRADLQLLPQGDGTQIGEKGVNLSGGQKARVALARAVYQKCELYLLDDPLSAVDNHVGRWIFDRVIGPRGLLAGRTRLLVTHGLHFLRQTDQILLMEDGQIVERGTYAELSALLGGKFAQLVAEGKIAEEHGQPQEEAGGEAEDNDGAEDKFGSGSCEELASPGEIDRQNSLLEQQWHKQSNTEGPTQRRRLASADSGTTSRKTSRKATQGQPPQQLVEEERVQTGRVKFAVYLSYMRAAGWAFSVLFVAMFCANQSLQMGRNFWLSDWADSNQQESLNNTTAEEAVPSSTDVHQRLIVYAAFGILEAFSFWAALVALLLGGLRASHHLHSPMLARVMRAPMAFFDATPVGRLLNRFSRDVEVADSILPVNMRYFVQCISVVLATLATICISTWTFALAIIPIFLCYYYTLRLYVPSSRQLKRLESSHRSPIYSHFGESIQGAPSIRAFRRQTAFCAQMECRVDAMMRIKSLSLVANRWLAVRLELLGNCVVLFAAMFGALSRELDFVSSAGLIGLSVSYALNITEVMNFAIRQISELETNIVSIERLKEYAEVALEAPWELADHRPPLGWPQSGEIRFAHYSTRYRPGLELVLKDIVATVRPSEKVGIVGRTGAGKSSLTLALFRMIEPAAGSIIIDGLDIGLLGLHDLRANLTIIPQDPVLFSGTLRFNLDPFGVHADARLWQALEHAHLRTLVSTLPGGLDHEISEGGENISLGQRQLLCLARALLRSSRILVLDEATASVDMATDALIQETIRREFRHCTVFTIAHRLATILDYDRVVVLQEGHVREFDAPQALLADPHSLFAAMAAAESKDGQ